MLKISFTFCILSVAAVSLSFGGDNPRNVFAVRVTRPPHIDGILDDSVWLRAEPASAFLQREPDEGKPGSQRTEIRVLYDDEALYFGCAFFDREPEKIAARLTRRDDAAESDQGSICIDAYNDNQTCYQFSFNVSGVKIDALEYDDGGQSDDSWDPVWDLQTRITPEGWTAEIKIPFRVLRYKTMASDTAENTLGINFFRYISRRQENDRWAFNPKSESGFISRFGHLRGLRNLPDPSRIEALPFIVGKQRYMPATGALRRTEEFVGNAGLDLKYGVSSNFLLDATVNPDFGQVEADPAVLNLTTLETFYPEKRPFFIEGTQVLRFTTFGGSFGPGMFYSRRIGRAISPDEADPKGGYIESMPQNVTILGAAKLTGKTNGGLSVGILEAATQEERAVVIDSLGLRSEQVVEPFANYNVLRLKQDILENSNIGMIITSTVKNSRNPAFTNGYDWNLALDHNTYALTGFLALSHSTNSANERIDGSAGKIYFSRVAAQHWLWSIDGDYTGPKYNIDDIGFFFSPNDGGYVGTLAYKEDQPGPHLRNYSAAFRWHQRWNFDGFNLFRELNWTWNNLFLNYWSFSLGIDREFGQYDEFESRGNGLYAKPATNNMSASLTTDSRNAVVVLINQGYIWDGKLRRQYTAGLGAELKPFSWMSWQLDGQYQVCRDQEAWGRNSGVNGAAIFGDRSTDQYNFTLRNTTTFSRDLTLQIYAQVFLAKGRYANDRQFVVPSTFIPVDLREPPLGDFNRHFLNTNVVLRWEYSPGSTLYLVWSQARQDDEGTYAASFSGDLHDTFRIPPANVVLLKANYWLNL